MDILHIVASIVLVAFDIAAGADIIGWLGVSVVFSIGVVFIVALGLSGAVGIYGSCCEYWH